MRSTLAIAAVVASAFAIPTAASATAIDLSTLNLAGSAQLVGGSLQLTHTSSVSNASGVSGAAWLTQGISTASSFSTTFSFSLAGNDSGSMADGIALAFQNVGTNVTGVGGGDVGYWNIGGSGSSAVGSVIRTWTNNDYGLSTNGVVQGLKDTPFDLGAANKVTGTETVSYNATTHELTLSGVFIDANTGQSYNISDSKTVDLSAKFGSTMYVGFTGGTAGADANQSITSFSLTSAVPEPATYAMLLAGLGMVGAISRRRKKAV
ncbi:PEPxxWA-CTERM sorting domain-containing protein [Duganella sp. FT80W]|uniref:PEPxxWA-CTERM sorting domain-containing protein n=1 Tax=Duganella guangzhouensis TaxID=2666084 RepID=A0A6I2KZR2_9BURK|nr:PEPxxWA-CTERM sorting domain-containing protein [Duganella guangzhouensis]MRW91388.1 PEPxxWA-CTERM sorting domain-containing protein [Duganella guangzhouensis]